MRQRCGTAVSDKLWSGMTRAKDAHRTHRVRVFEDATTRTCFRCPVANGT